MVNINTPHLDVVRRAVLDALERPNRDPWVTTSNLATAAHSAISREVFAKRMTSGEAAALGTKTGQLQVGNVSYAAAVRLALDGQPGVLSRRTKTWRSKQSGQYEWALESGVEALREHIAKRQADGERVTRDRRDVYLDGILVICVFEHADITEEMAEKMAKAAETALRNGLTA